MKYIKSPINTPLDDLKMGKVCLTVTDDEGPFSESPWSKKAPDNSFQVLMNHALIFLPFFSWGLIIHSCNYNIDCNPIIDGDVLEIHPEAWDYYLTEGVIDQDGNLIKECMYS